MGPKVSCKRNDMIEIWIEGRKTLGADPAIHAERLRVSPVGNL